MNEALNPPEEYIDLVSEKAEYTGALQATRWGSAFTFLGDLRWALSKEAMGAGGEEKGSALEAAILGDRLVRIRNIHGTYTENMRTMYGTHTEYIWTRI